MLVLSRRPAEKIVFPGINTSVQVVAVKPGVVRLGIEAPSEIKVFREEIVGPSQVQDAVQALGSQVRELNHLVRNRVNAATIGLALLRRQLKAGLGEAAEATLEKLDQQIQLLRQQVEGASQKAVALPSAPPRKARALLVEDDSNERELLAGFLRMAGLDVVTAGDGDDALDYLRDQDRPDVVLLDMVLPRCDGPTTVREIRRDPALAGLKIFAVTGHAPDRFGLESGAAGVDRWFNKPLNPEAFLRDLNRELGPGV